MTMDMMITPHQTAFALLTSVGVFVLILDLVRRRRLREEYSWLWLLTGATMIVLIVWYRFVLGLTWLIGAVSPVTTLLICSTLFLLAIALHYSVIISRLTTQVKNLTQELALLESRLRAAEEWPVS